MKLILKKSGGIFDIENLKNEIDNLEKKTFEADFWNSENSQEILKTISAKKKLLEELSLMIFFWYFDDTSRGYRKLL